MYTDKPKLTAELLRPECQGRWLEIFQYLCPGTFDDAIANLGVHVTCPFHGGKEDFRFTKVATKHGGSTAQCGVAMCSCGAFTDGFAVLRRALNAPFFEVLKRVDEYLHGDSAPQAPPPVIVPTEKVRSDDDKLASVKKLWSARKAFSPVSTPYYVERGISPFILKDIQDVGVLSQLGYYKKEGQKLVKVDNFPAILAAMRNAKGEVVAVHRTWLSKDRKGKAPVSSAKKLSETPGAAGAAIRLFDAKGSSILGLTEGVETGCGVRQLAAGGYWPDIGGSIPVWAAYSERNIRSFVVPEFLLPTLRKIIVFADMDASWTGIKAALAFKQRMAIEHPEIEVVIKVPHFIGWDWLDVLDNL
jgi:putative DNA primase/helicase